MTLGRIGGGLIILAGAVLAYVLAQPPPVIDGRVYAPDVTVPALLLGLGAVLVSIAGPKPLDGRLARAGVVLIAIGAVAVAAIKTIESGDNPMAGLAPVVVALASFIGGGLAIGASLARRRRGAEGRM